MWKRLVVSFVAFVMIPQLGYGQESKAILDGVAKSMGDVKSLQYTGSRSEPIANSAVAAL
jgi:hypothetical protein